MGKIKKVKRRPFTEKQLNLIEQHHYLYKKLCRSGLMEDEGDYFNRLTDKIRKFIDFN